MMPEPPGFIVVVGVNLTIKVLPLVEAPSTFDEEVNSTLAVGSTICWTVIEGMETVLMPAEQMASEKDLMLSVRRIWEEKGVWKLVIFMRIDWFDFARSPTCEKIMFRVSEAWTVHEPTTTPAVRDSQTGGYDCQKVL